MPVLHAFELLQSSPESMPPLIALIGGSRTTRTWVLHHLTGSALDSNASASEDEDTFVDIQEVDGDDADWIQIRDDLCTASLFSTGERRNIVIRSADKFVSAHRPELEKYAAKPGSEGRLILDVDTMAANTKIYKSIEKNHWVIPCAPPQNKTRGGKSTDLAKLLAFLCDFVAPRHQCQIQKDAADLLVQWLGEDMGMLDTEIARLAVYLPPHGTIDSDLVRQVTSGWKGQTIWQIIDAAASGNTADALLQLDRLMLGGDRPIALLPQMAWSLRRLGLATAAVEHAEAIGQPTTLAKALSKAGLRGGRGEMEKAEKQLRSMGRVRARQILPWLLEADLKLKGSHSTEGPDRWVLEELFLKMAQKQPGREASRTS